MQRECACRERAFAAYSSTGLVTAHGRCRDVHEVAQAHRSLYGASEPYTTRQFSLRVATQSVCVSWQQISRFVLQVGMEVDIFTRRKSAPLDALAGTDQKTTQLLCALVAIGMMGLVVTGSQILGASSDLRKPELL